MHRPADRRARHRPVGRPERARSRLNASVTRTTGHDAAVTFDVCNSIAQGGRTWQIQCSTTSSWNKACKVRLGGTRRVHPRLLPSPTARSAPGTRGVMTVSGTLTATGVLMVLLLAAATVGWIDGASTTAPAPAASPHWRIVGMLVGFACVIAMHFKPTMAKVLAPIYALAEGFFLGAISKAYENYHERHRRAGRRRNARRVRGDAGALPHPDHQGHRQVPQRSSFRPRWVSWRSTSSRSSSTCSAATSRSCTRRSLFGIVFSLFAAGLAAMNLALDFDFIERGAKQGLPKGMEWFAAFGAARHPGVAVPRDAAPAQQSCSPLATTVDYRLFRNPSNASLNACGCFLLHPVADAVEHGRRRGSRAAGSASARSPIGSITLTTSCVPPMK